jgi:hypothetical protein
MRAAPVGTGMESSGAEGGAFPSMFAPDSLRREHLIEASRGDEGTRIPE